jgi:hypothetical protein
VKSVGVVSSGPLGCRYKHIRIGGPRAAWTRVASGGSVNDGLAVGGGGPVCWRRMVVGEMNNGGMLT